MYRSIYTCSAPTQFFVSLSAPDKGAKGQLCRIETFIQKKKIKELLQFHNDKYPIENQKKGAYGVLQTRQGSRNTWEGEQHLQPQEQASRSDSRPRSMPTQMAGKDKAERQVLDTRPSSYTADGVADCSHTGKGSLSS